MIAQRTDRRLEARIDILAIDRGLCACQLVDPTRRVAHELSRGRLRDGQADESGSNERAGQHFEREGREVSWLRVRVSVKR